MPTLKSTQVSREAAEQEAARNAKQVQRAAEVAEAVAADPKLQATINERTEQLRNERRIAEEQSIAAEAIEQLAAERAEERKHKAGVKAARTLQRMVPVRQEYIRRLEELLEQIIIVTDSMCDQRAAMQLALGTANRAGVDTGVAPGVLQLFGLDHDERSLLMRAKVALSQRY